MNTRFRTGIITKSPILELMRRDDEGHRLVRLRLPGADSMVQTEASIRGIQQREALDNISLLTAHFAGDLIRSREAGIAAIINPGTERD